MLSGPSLDGASWHAWPPAAEEHASAKRVAGDDDDMALAKRPRSDDGAAVVAATVEQQQQALAAMRELHPPPFDQHAPPIVLDASLPFVLEAPAPTPRTRKLRPEQEKARASFVAQHAGQTYEQMVLEHAYSSDRLYWLKEAYQLSWRTGRWSADEEDRATAALDKFCQHHQLSQAALDELIWHRRPDQKQLHEELWKHIALSVGTRPNYAVRMHIKSMRKDVLRGGHWTSEDVAALSPYVTSHVKRFGDYLIDVDALPEPYEIELALAA